MRGGVQVEVGERKDRVTDALNATKAAVDEGIVAGGGAALLHASRSLADIKEGMANLDQRVGVDIVARAVQMPAKTILKNAGHEGAVIVGKLLESDDPNYGYDSATDKYCDMVAAGARLDGCTGCATAIALVGCLVSRWASRERCEPAEVKATWLCTMPHHRCACRHH